MKQDSVKRANQKWRRRLRRKQQAAKHLKRYSEETLGRRPNRKVYKTLDKSLDTDHT